MISRRDFTQIVGLAAAGATVAGLASAPTASKYSHRVLDGIGHNVPQEAPRQFADAIIEVAGY
jgi:pimeloyl-ACP methyl ester carboxylesterase